MDHLEGKKILYLITQSKYGGAQKYLLDLAQHFRQTNTVLIAVGDKANQDEQFFSEARSLGIEPIVLDHLIRDISLVKAFDAVLEIRKLLIKERPDILHINSSMAGAVASAAAWIYGFDPLNRLLRVVYTVHGFVFNEPFSKTRKKIYTIIEKISASWKGAIITVSEYDKQQGISHKIAPERRMVVIRNGIDTTTRFLDRSQARSLLDIPSNATPVIGTVASLYPVKGIQFLIEAASELVKNFPALDLRIIGDGPERQSYERLIKEKKLGGNVHLVGYKKNAHELMRAFDIFVLPSLKEGFPFVILEAGLAGVPCVASRVGGIPEIITQHENGILTEPGKPADIVMAVQTLMKDESLRTRYVQKLQSKIRKEFTRERMFEETEELYLRFYQRRT